MIMIQYLLYLSQTNLHTYRFKSLSSTILFKLIFYIVIFNLFYHYIRSKLLNFDSIYPTHPSKNLFWLS